MWLTVCGFVGDDPLKEPLLQRRRPVGHRPSRRRPARASLGSGAPLEPPRTAPSPQLIRHNQSIHWLGPDPQRPAGHQCSGWHHPDPCCRAILHRCARGLQNQKGLRILKDCSFCGVEKSWDTTASNDDDASFSFINISSAMVLCNGATTIFGRF